MKKDLFDLADAEGGLYLEGYECQEIIKLHQEGQQAHDLAVKDFKAIKDKLKQISCLAFDDGRLNRKLLCSLVDELEGLTKNFDFPAPVDCHEYIVNTADSYEALHNRMQQQYALFFTKRQAV